MENGQLTIDNGELVYDIVNCPLSIKKHFPFPIP